MPRALLKPDAVPTLRLPPATKPTIPPANETTLKRRRTLGDEPVDDLYCFEGDAPRTQANFFAKGVTSDWVQTDGSGDTAISASTSIPVPSASDDDDSDEEEEEEDDDEDKDPTYEPFIKESCVG
ncbi:uncharacterized protein ISCGN_016399 [Ixodes scapularis]